MNVSCNILSELLKTNRAMQEKTLQKGSTFLEILGRTYDEDLISRILAYAIQTLPDLPTKLFHFYFDRQSRPEHSAAAYTFTNIECEKAMLNGRADLFLTARGADGNAYTLTIENKIYSWEHDNQTAAYYRFVENNYADSRNAYLFLKPRFNASPVAGTAFVVLHYDQLAEMLGEPQDAILADFKKHIGENLMNDLEISELDRQVYDHIQELRNILNDAEEKFTTVRRRVYSALCTANTVKGLYYNPFDKNATPWSRIPQGAPVVEIADNESSFRIYRKDLWYFKGADDSEKYYFYAELKFVNKDPYRIKFQTVVKRYGQRAGNSVITRFLTDKAAARYHGHWEKQWYVFSELPYRNEAPVLSPAWIDNLITFAAPVLTQFIQEIDDIFAVFKAWKSKQNL